MLGTPVRLGLISAPEPNQRSYAKIHKFRKVAGPTASLETGFAIGMARIPFLKPFRPRH